MGLQERMAAAATRLANNHREDKTLRNDAMRAIGGNLADLRKAMSLQRTFDRTTVKRVADLARVLITNGYINNATSGEIKRLLSAVKNSVGHNDIEGDVQKVMDIMVDNQLKHAEETLHELEAIKGSKVDARGVEVQGLLDAEGAHVMKVFKKSRGWEKTNIEEALSEAQQRMGSSDASVADEDILRDVINFINENYGKRKEIEAARAAAVERKKQRALSQRTSPEALGQSQASLDQRSLARAFNKMAMLKQAVERAKHQKMQVISFGTMTDEEIAEALTNGKVVYRRQMK